MQKTRQCRRNLLPDKALIYQGLASGRSLMSVLSALLCGWIAFSAALFAALWFRRPNPRLRAKLFDWVLRGSPKRGLRRPDYSRSRT
jgi:hypothetical protein